MISLNIKNFISNNLEFIDELANKYMATIVPFYSNSIDKHYDVNGFGSGFIVKFQDSYFIITAYHVFIDIDKHGFIAIRIGEHTLILEHMKVFSNKQNDISVFCIDEWMNKNNISQLPHITLDEKHSFEPMPGISYSLLMGYPATKNKVKDSSTGLNPSLLSITAEPLPEEEIFNVDIHDPIFYRFDHKNQINTYLKKFGRPPHLHGMSGGPAFGIGIRKNQSNLEVTLILKGVLVEWHKDKKAIIASDKETIIELMSYIKELAY